MMDQSSEVLKSKADAFLEKYRALYSSKRQEELKALAHIKRFLERFTGDMEFRSGVLTGLFDLERAAASIGCDVGAVDFSTLRPIFHPDYVDQRTPELLPNWPAANLWNEYHEAQRRLREEILYANDTNGHSIPFDHWRIRQVNRASADLGISHAGIVHPAVAFEVSSGCSVGCWFCGVSAERFRGHFSLENGGADEWRAILDEVGSVLGEGLRSGFLYWATDPLDNPEYLGILDIFHEYTKVYPQTTSAIPLRNIELTRGVLERWEKGGAVPNRFSILNTKTLLGVHEEFTPEELLHVELVLQNTGNSHGVKNDAGKAITIKAMSGPKGAVKKGFAMQQGTIACVSGFLINIVEKTVRLVSPCMPSSDIPDGFIVFDKASYTTASELGQVLQQMIDQNMAVDLDPAAPIAFCHNLKYCSVDGAGVIEGSATRIEAPMVDLFGQYLADGPIAPRELLKRAVLDGKNPFAVVNAIQKTRFAGLIDTITQPG